MFTLRPFLVQLPFALVLMAVVTVALVYVSATPDVDLHFASLANE